SHDNYIFIRHNGGFFFSSRRRHTRSYGDWSSDVCSSDLGVIVGIAAQQSLGNVFAGMVLLMARVFRVGDRVRIRSGPLGGEVNGAISSVGLAYVVLDTEDGPLHVPNSAVLAAAVGPQPRAAHEPRLAEHDHEQQ